MTLMDIQGILGVSRFREVGKNTTVVELSSGFVHPATELEVRMWNLITTLTGEPGARA